MRVAVFALARPTFDVPLAEAKAKAALTSLRAAGAEPLGGGALAMDAPALEARLGEIAAGPAPEAVLILQASFCDAEMARRIAAAHPGLPLAIWAFPEARDGGRLRLNSFCGLNLAAHALGKTGREIGWRCAPETAPPDLASLFGAPAPAPTLRPARDPAPEAAARALADLAGAVGLIGTRPDGFDTCDFDAPDLKSRFNVDIQPIDLETFFSAAKDIAPARVAALHAETATRLHGLDTLEAEPLDKALRSYAALTDIAEEGGLKALAMRCWPETFTEYGCAVCGAMARLGEDGRPAACEADVLGAVGSRLLQSLAGGPSMLVDIVDMDPGDDSAVFWHCGLAPLDYCDPEARAEAALHTNRVKPLLHQFPLKPGPVTVMRISQARGALALVVGRGEMLRRPMAFTGTSGVVRLAAGTEKARAALIDGRLEHHLSIVYGDVKDGLESVAARVGLPVLDLDAL